MREKKNKMMQIRNMKMFKEILANLLIFFRMMENGYCFMGDKTFGDKKSIKHSPFVRSASQVHAVDLVEDLVALFQAAEFQDRLDKADEYPCGQKKD